MSSLLYVLHCLLLFAGASGFGILPDRSLSHLEITERAILNATVQICHAVARAEGADFTPPAQPFTAENVAVACRAPKSIKSFRTAINSIIIYNVRVDLRHVLNASFHFDDESFVQGKKIITDGLQATKASIKQRSFEAAWQTLGKLLHPLQDFYSHTNHLELGKLFPNSNLIKSKASIGKIADKSRPTCRSCDGDDCRNNILESIREEQILTSGYFNLFDSEKPSGKCSHGGRLDQTSKKEPKGGINKDSFDASHGHLHSEAANMAIAATSELLADIQGDVGDKKFLEMVGIFRGSSKALCFVIDTTNSMKEDIEAVKKVTHTIINREVETDNKSSVYILVPFNDPEFGPLIKTTDSAVFKTVINTLTASGGGDNQEMSLSGLQLALSAAPFNSEIFLFTDAPAKDTQLKSTVIAFLERTQTVVNFMITNSTIINRRRRRNLQNSNQISDADLQVYIQLAQASGGQVIEVTKNELPEATSIIIESTNSSLVTILQAVRTPGRTETFSFLVDESVTNPTVYITGHSFTFTLTSPTGESQQSTDTSGSLITASQSVGNFRSLRLQKLSGLWEIKMVSSSPYTLKVIGQSPIDFIFDFVVASQALSRGLMPLNHVPHLVELQDRQKLPSPGQQLPSTEFVVRLKGHDDSYTSSSPVYFQRQSSTNFRSSNLTITADSDNIIEPGTPFTVPFSVTTHGPEGNITIRATNSRGFNLIFPTSLFLETGTSANGTVTFSAPLSTPSGSDVTLTIEAEAPGGADTNYIVLRFSIVKMATETSQTGHSESTKVTLYFYLLCVLQCLDSTV
ncbi:von Willebrand factor A domain-containing protein 7-like [Pholidichthys leucotaenia]